MSTELSKATLERKDKDELTQIAVAMGGKPASRARKAEIVDLILELAGVGDTRPEEAPDEAGQPAGGKGDRTADEAGGDTGRSDAGAGRGASRAANGSAYTADPMADVRAAESGGGRARSDGGGDRDNGAATGSADDGNDSGAKNDAGAAQDANDQGSRRRRRRGRGRDRNEGGEEWIGEPVDVEGYLDLREDGYGFLRVNGYLPTKDDVYVSVKQVRQYELRKGDHLAGAGRPANRSEKNPALVRIDSVNGRDPDQAVNRVHFDELTAVHPSEPLGLEYAGAADQTSRIIDLFAPVGKGQRGLIAAPPAANKLDILKEVAKSIEVNHPDVELLVLLLDERPEDVTEMERWLDRGEVISSTFDRPADEHVTIAELTLERARRMVESGQDVVILFDGLTRFARAYNQAGGSSGRQLPGGIDANALHHPKRFFGAARNLEEGGSLTVLATIRVGSDSALDKAIFDEFAETANMELWLDVTAAERRLAPPVDPVRSGTRRADLLVDEHRAAQVGALRDRLATADDSVEALRQLINELGAQADTDRFLAGVGRSS